MSIVTKKLDLVNWLKKHRLPESYAFVAQRYFQPLADKIYRCQQQRLRPYFVGINGCQGSGKSTLADYLKWYLFGRYQVNCLVMSLDDFYLTGKERQKLAQTVHPLFSTRGVPGTHNISVLTEILNKLTVNKAEFFVPQFDKALDEPKQSKDWLYLAEVPDVVLVEGWCWGVSAQSEQQLMQPVNELEQLKDEQGLWRRYVNDEIVKYYQPLYALMDYWVMLAAPSFDCVFNWRLEQEAKLAQMDDTGGNKIMSSVEIAEFIQYFQRLTIESLSQLPKKVDHLFKLDDERNIQTVQLRE